MLRLFCNLLKGFAIFVCNFPVKDNQKWEPLSPKISVLVTPEHHFSTDTLLLAWFSMPKNNEMCADFGTGCGTIPLLWAARSKPQKIWAVEIQKQAAAQANFSVNFNNLQEKIQVINADLRSISTEHIPKNLHLVAFNPPYKAIGSGIVNKNNSSRVARHEQTCTLKEASEAASSVLRFGGRFCLCQRPERLCDATEAMRSAGIEPKRMRLVQYRASKRPSLFLLEGRKGGNPGLVIEPVLLLTDDNGNQTEELKQIYGTYAREELI